MAESFPPFFHPRLLKLFSQLKVEYTGRWGRLLSPGALFLPGLTCPIFFPTEDIRILVLAPVRLQRISPLFLELVCAVSSPFSQV